MENVVIGDPHVTPKTLDQAQALVGMIESYGRPAIWLGDFLDTKEVIRGKCQNLLFRYLRDSKLQHRIVVGNHDWFNLECEDHSLLSLSSLPNVTIIDKPTLYPDEQTAFLPYIHDQDKLKSELDKIPDGWTVFGHFEVKDFDYGNGRICENGLTKEYFKRFKRVVSGHFHKFQEIDNFMYLGTPYSHSFGETDQSKFLATIDLPSSELKLFNSPFPRHVTLKLNVDEPNHLDTLNAFVHKNMNKIRVQLFGSPENVTKLNRGAYPSYDIKWEDKSEGTVDENQKLDETLDNKTQFVQWATQIRNLDDSTVQLGLSILEGLNAK
jgi:DNA repair exonuclease SbcCD nuclease subunit